MRLWLGLGLFCAGLMAAQIPEPVRLREAAQTEESLGNFGAAEKLWRQLLALPAEGPDRTADQLALGRNLLAQGKSADAGTVLRPAVKELEESRGEQDPGLLPLLSVLYRALVVEQKWADAELILLRRIRISERPGGDSQELAQYLAELAGFYQSRQRLAVAEPYYRRSLDLLTARFGLCDPKLLPVLEPLSGLLRDLKRPAETELILRRILAIRELSVSEGGSDLASALDNLALLLYQTRRFSEAEPLYRRSLGIWISVLGPRHALVAGGHENLALTLAAQGRLADAEREYRAALNIVAQGTERAAHGLATTLAGQGKLQETKHLYQAHQRLIDALPDDFDLLPAILEHYAGVLRKAGRPAAAARLEQRLEALKGADQVSRRAR